MDADEESVAYAEHLHHEHHRLNRLLLEIGHEVARLVGPPADRTLLQRLETRITDLWDQLKAHFAEEEDGGCLEEAVTRCPALAVNLQSIMEEHSVLEQLLGQLLAEVSNPSIAPAEVGAKWQAFYNKIRAHEAAETRLLRMAFGHESAEYDTEDEE